MQCAGKQEDSPSGAAKTKNTSHGIMIKDVKSKITILYFVVGMARIGEQILA